MALGDDKIKDLFSSKLGNSFEPEVSASVWSGLDQILSTPTAEPTGNSSSSAQTKSLTNTYGFKAGTAILAAGVIGGAAYFFTSGEENIQEIVVEDISETTMDDNTTQNENTLVLKEEDFEREGNKSTTRPNPKRISTPTEAPVETSFVETHPQPLFQIADTTKVEQEEKPLQTDTLSADSIARVLDMEEEIVRSKTWYIAPNVGFTLSGATVDQFGPSGMLFSENYRSELFISLLNEERAEFTIIHDQPINIGLLLGRKLNQRLSIESGLVFTRLKSTLSSTSRYNMSESRQLDYLGIPLNLRYSFYELGKLSFDASLGMMAQKDFKGTMKSTVAIEKPNMEELYPEEKFSRIYYIEPYYIRSDIRQPHIQYSVHGSLGVTYPIYRNLYIYTTFSGGYYFEAGNRYRTLYSDKKFLLNTNAGFRINF